MPAKRNKPWNFKPTVGAQLNYSVAKELGLVFASFFPHYGLYFDDLTGTSRVGSTAPTVAIGPRGPCVRDWVITSASTTDLNFTTGTWSVAAWFSLPVAVANSHYPEIFFREVYTNESSNSGWSLQIRPPNDPNPGYNFLVSNNNSTYQLASATTAVGDHFIVGTTDGTTRSLYLDGLLANSSTSNPSAATSAGTMGNVSDTEQLPVYACLAANRCWTPTQIWQLNSERYKWVAPAPIRYGRFFNATSGIPAMCGGGIALSRSSGGGWQ